MTTGKLCSRKVPSKLICPGYEKYSKLKMLSPHNILFCSIAKLDHVKPVMSELVDILCKYFGSLSPDINKNNIIIASFACHQAMTIRSCKCGLTEDCTCKVETKTKDRVGPNPAPVIHT